MKARNWRYLFIFIAVFLPNINTLTLDYALDDRLVIFENNYTLQGWAGTKDIFTQDSFSGYFGHEKNLVAGGRYRPLAQFTFMVEYELFGGDLKNQVGMDRDPRNEQLFTDSILPTVSHFGNLVLYLLLAFLIYHTLKTAFPRWDHEKWYLSIPFVATILFVLHPLHVEAVANIKGRDEIMTMLGAFFALYTSIQFVITRKKYYLLLSFLGILFSLFSKENGITFLAVVPLVLYFMDSKPQKWDYFWTLIPLFIGSAIFLYVRYRALGSMMATEEVPQILNNPFLHATFGERIATVLYTWAIYLKLMIFPHPLTHDYYPHQIEITNFSNPVVLLVLLGIVGLIYLIIKGFRKKTLIALAISYFIITFSITSNLLFSVGTFMNDRFLFIPLLGFTLIISFFFILILKKMGGRKVPAALPYITLLPLFILYGAKTFARNFVWKNDIKLFTTDVLVSDNSIKCNTSAGGSYLKLYKESPKERYLKSAYTYLSKALQLDPTSTNAQMLLAEYYFYKKEYAESYQIYNQIATSNPNHELAAQNAQLVLQAWHGNRVEETTKLLEEGKAVEAMQQINQLIQEQGEQVNLLIQKGRVFGQGFNRTDSARVYFRKVLAIDPNNAQTLENMGVSFAIENRLDSALYYLERALEYNPNSETLQQNIEMVKQNLKK